MLSLAMACRSRGAPVSDCSPAPHVEKKEPITMTQGVGHARVPTTRFPFTESPNLQESRIFKWSDKRASHLITSHLLLLSLILLRTQAHMARHSDTDLSLRTTPSIQDPNKTTLLRSEKRPLRKIAIKKSVYSAFDT